LYSGKVSRGLGGTVFATKTEFVDLLRSVISVVSCVDGALASAIDRVKNAIKNQTIVIIMNLIVEYKMVFCPLRLYCRLSVVPLNI